MTIKMNFNDFLEEHYEEIYDISFEYVMDEEHSALFDIAYESVLLQQEDAGREFEEDEFDGRLNLGLEPLVKNAIMESVVAFAHIIAEDCGVTLIIEHEEE